MTYSPGIGAATREKVRYLIGDTGAGKSPAQPEVFTDDELDMVIDEAGGGLYDSAALAYIALASNAARHAIAWKILSQDFEIDKRDIPKHFRGLADDMGDRAAISGTAGECATWTDENVEEMLEGLHEAGFYDFQRWEE
jgi:hypothetical protein